MQGRVSDLKLPQSMGKWDVYLCLVAGVGLLAHACLGSAGLLASQPLAQAAGAALGLSSLVLPGYTIARLAGFERYGVAAFAGLAISLSLGLLAVVGAILWLPAQKLSLPVFEALVAVLLLGLNSLALFLSRSSQANGDQGRTRWQALCLTLIPLGLAAWLLTGWLPDSPTSGYTEFYVVRGKPTVSVTVKSSERQPLFYRITAESSGGTVSSAWFKLVPGQSWEGPVTLPPDTQGQILVNLYRENDKQPYRSLWLQ